MVRGLLLNKRVVMGCFEAVGIWGGSIVIKVVGAGMVDGVSLVPDSQFCSELPLLENVSKNLETR